MASESYWAVFVDEVLPEMGIALTKEQRDELIDGIVGHASMEYEATGQSVFDDNLHASRQREIDDAKKALRHEEEKITCRTCEGTGNTTTYGGTFMCRSSCYECNGAGRVHPSKASSRTLGII